MPPHDSSDDETRRNRHAAQLRPDATQVAHARALLSEIERRVLAMKSPGAPVTARDAVARVVRELFGDG